MNMLLCVRRLYERYDLGSRFGSGKPERGLMPREEE